MSKIVIHGGSRLFGSVKVQGSKNSALPIMAASLLNSGITVIQNCPDISDVRIMRSILEYIGCVINRDDDALIIDSKNAVSKEITPDMTSKLRASSVLLGPMLARFKKVQIASPGGCDIGSRPLDIHLEAVKRLGAVWHFTDDALHVEARLLSGSDIYLRFPSVGATQNAVMAATMASGITHISNAAKEPEVVCLCQFLKSMGVDISGEGTQKIIVKGMCELTDTLFKVPADRIAAGTYMAAVGACGGDIRLIGCTPDDMHGFLNVYRDMGIHYMETGDDLRIWADERLKNIEQIDTGPYPDFPTDMQSVTMSVASVSLGMVKINENIFENRFKIVKWLQKMGALISVDGKCVSVCGVKRLHGAGVCGEDLRGTAALVVAGLSADGITVIENADYIYRGYVNICENFRKLGADIEWKYM